MKCKHAGCPTPCGKDEDYCAEHKREILERIAGLQPKEPRGVPKDDDFNWEAFRRVRRPR
jgi:hypothetical protein